MTTTKYVWFVTWAETGFQCYRRELESAHWRKDGELDMRYSGSRFIVAYEAGKAKGYGLIRMKPLDSTPT